MDSTNTHFDMATCLICNATKLSARGVLQHNKGCVLCYKSQKVDRRKKKKGARRKVNRR